MFSKTETTLSLARTTRRERGSSRRSSLSDKSELLKLIRERYLSPREPKATALLIEIDSNGRELYARPTA